MDPAAQIRYDPEQRTLTLRNLPEPMRAQIEEEIAAKQGAEE